MSEVYMMITITSRQKLPAFLAFYEKKLPVGFVSLGYGTVKDEILDLLGLDRSEKAVCLHTVTGEVWKETKGHLRRKLYIDMPDTGIAFIVPMSSIGGKRELAYLTAGQDYRKGEESVMTHRSPSPVGRRLTSGLRMRVRFRSPLKSRSRGMSSSGRPGAIV